jgi:hypothetical protein
LRHSSPNRISIPAKGSVAVRYASRQEFRKKGKHEDNPLNQETMKQGCKENSSRQEDRKEGIPEEAMTEKRRIGAAEEFRPLS